MQGYLAAMEESGIMSADLHCYSSALLNCITSHSDLVNLIQEAP